MLQDLFKQTRNAMVKALLDAGVDPLLTGSVMAHSEKMGFYLAGLENRLIRLEKKVVTRQIARQKGSKRQKPTETNVVAFPGVKR